MARARHHAPAPPADEDAAAQARCLQRLEAFLRPYARYRLYPRRHGAGDLGLHLPEGIEAPAIRTAPALCWIQLRHLSVAQLASTQLAATDKVQVQLPVAGLREWYLQPVPAHLLLWVESVDEFLVLDLQRYVRQRWGARILTLRSPSAAVAVPASDFLDEAAFHAMAGRCGLDAWRSALSTRAGDNLYHRLNDLEIVYAVGAARSQGADFRMVFVDWQQKPQGQVVLQQRAPGSLRWVTLRESWKHAISIDDLEDRYPYLEPRPPERNDVTEEWSFAGDRYGVVEHTFSGGQRVIGEGAADQYIEYRIPVRLNAQGRALHEWLEILGRTGVLEITTRERRMPKIRPAARSA